MGKSRTPKYRLEVTDLVGNRWNTACDFSPTDANLINWVKAFNNSVQNGHNSHLGYSAMAREVKVIAQTGIRKNEMIKSVSTSLSFTQV